MPIGSFFVPAITCNDFVFVAGQMATDENALDPSVRLPKEVRNWGGPNAIRRQTALAWMGKQGRHPHPFVAVQVPGELPAPGAALTADFWIYAP